MAECTETERAFLEVYFGEFEAHERQDVIHAAAQAVLVERLHRKKPELMAILEELGRSDERHKDLYNKLTEGLTPAECGVIIDIREQQRKAKP